MENHERRHAAPTHLGVHLLWAVIVGYGLLALPSALLVTGRGAHVIGLAGAVGAVALTLRRHGRGRRRPRPMADRPHDGWIG